MFTDQGLLVIAKYAYSYA